MTSVFTTQIVTSRRSSTIPFPAPQNGLCSPQYPTREEYPQPLVVLRKRWEWRIYLLKLSKTLQCPYRDGCSCIFTTFDQVGRIHVIFIILEELLTSVRQSKDILLVPFRSDLKVTVATTPVPVLYVPGSTISPVMETFPDVILLVTAGKKVPLVTVCASRYAGSYTTQISVEVI